MSGGVNAEDGFPVRLHVPDPRFFALNKLWVSELSSRDPVKRPRDREQAEIVAHLAEDYLGLSFDDPALRVFPKNIRDKIHQINRSAPFPRMPLRGG